jgi:hypothetical protein
MSFSIQFECNDKDAAPNFILIDIDRRQFTIDKKILGRQIKDKQALQCTRYRHRPKL